MLLLGAYSAGLALPFLASALAFGQFLRFFARFKRFLPVVDRVAGLLLIGIGLPCSSGAWRPRLGKSERRGESSAGKMFPGRR